MADDPFPRDPFVAMLRRLPAYLRLSWRLAREPLLSRSRRAVIAVAAGYLASPIDLVPGVIPVVGQLDDLAVALAAIRFALAGLSPERRRVHLDAVGLADEDIATDLRTVGATSAWIVRATGRTTARVAGAGARAAVRSAVRVRDIATPRLAVVAGRLPRPFRRRSATIPSSRDRPAGDA